MKLAPFIPENIDFITTEAKNDLLNSSLYSGRLINKSGDVTLLIVRFDSFKKVHKRMDKIIPEIKRICEESLGKEQVHFSGADIITFGLNELSRKDFIKFTGLSYLIMFLVIALFYRKVIYVLLSFLIAFSTIWLTLSTYGFFGLGLNIFTVMTPPLVIIISIMMSMHIFNEFEDSNSSEYSSGKEKAVACLSAMFRPCLFAVLTSMIGFLSLLSSPTSVLKEFGWLTAVGCLFAFLLTFAWSAILLPYVNVANKELNKTYRLATLVGNFIDFVLQKRKLFASVSLVATIIAIIGVFYIKIDMNPIEYLPNHNRVVKDHHFMEKNWGDYYPIDIVVQANDPFKINDKAIINTLIDFDAQLTQQGLARSTFSFVKIMEQFAAVRYNKSLEAILRSPFESRSFVNSFEKVVEKESNSLITDDQKKTRVTMTGSLQSVRSLENSIKEMVEISKSVFKDKAQIKVSGYPALFVSIMNTTFESMRSSLTIAFILVFTIMLLLLKDIKLAFYAMLANMFPVFIMFGFLGFSGINLDLGTCTIAAIILGIAIDDTVHILYRFRKEHKTGKSIEDAIKATHYHIGRVVVLTSLVLFLGFSVMLFAGLKTVFYFGLLSLIAVIAIIYGDLVILTLLLKSKKQ